MVWEYPIIIFTKISFVKLQFDLGIFHLKMLVFSAKHFNQFCKKNTFLFRINVLLLKVLLLCINVLSDLTMLRF